MENTENKKNINLQNVAEATSYLKKNFSKDMFYGNGEIGAMVKRMWDGTELSQNDQTVLSAILPLSVQSCHIGEKKLTSGQCWDLSSEYKDGNIDLVVDKLIMETGARVVCRGKVLNLTIGTLQKNHVGGSADANYDFGIFGSDGRNGASGSSGSKGPDGSRGVDGQKKLEGTAGKDATSGSDGGAGNVGYDGSSGKNGESVWATTIKINSFNEPITVLAKPGDGGNGGNGGTGGAGGKGGDGGNGITTGCTGNNGGNGGNGGDGGRGGDGANGGDGGCGGTVNVFVGAGLAAKVNIVARVSEGGKGGAKGLGGAGGDGGKGGSAGKYSQSGQDGRSGSYGEAGVSGNDGRNGTAPIINVSEM